MSKDFKLYTIKVTNNDTGRVDIHKNLSYDEVEYIKITPTLTVEVIEVNLPKKKRVKEQ